MSRHIIIPILAAAIFLGTAPCMHPMSAAAPNSADITAQELESGARRIIGHLGLPLGEVTSVKGRFVRVRNKEAESAFEVAEVAGKVLVKPVQMHFSIWQWGNLEGKELPMDNPVRLRVYETCSMAGVPLQAMKETAFVETVDWHFRTSLVVLFQETEKNGRI